MHRGKGDYSGNLIFFNLSVYGRDFKDGICLVALLCTLSSFSMSPSCIGLHTDWAYSRCGRTRATNNFLKFSSFRYLYDRLINPDILFYFFILSLMCSLKDSLLHVVVNT